MILLVCLANIYKKGYLYIRIEENECSIENVSYKLSLLFWNKSEANPRRYLSTLCHTFYNLLQAKLFSVSLCTTRQIFFNALYENVCMCLKHKYKVLGVFLSRDWSLSLFHTCWRCSWRDSTLITQPCIGSSWMIGEMNIPLIVYWENSMQLCIPLQ